MKVTRTFGLFTMTLVACGILGTSIANAAVLVSENFDSYADTAAMQVVWGGTGLGSLDSTQSFSPNNSALHPGGAVNNYLPGFGTVDASATENLVLSARILDDGVVPPVGDRNTVGLRGGPFPLFEMGHYNNPAHYAIRAVLFGNGINPGYINFKDGTGAAILPVAGWHTYVATFSLAGLDVSLDLGSDGTIDSTISVAGDGNPYGGFSDLRFGGPSNSSSGSSVNFDDISLETVTVPEPATCLLLVASMGIAVIRRKRA